MAILKTLTASQLEHVLLLIEEAHKATSAQALRQTIVYGVGALMDSVTCVWTELNTDLFKAKVATTTAVNINDDEVDVEKAVLVFNQYAWQHPVIAQVINTGDPSALSMSDFLTREEFKSLELYRYFYVEQSIEDQLSVGYVENGNVKGISVNRATWGFTKNERNLMEHIARCVFPFYRMLQHTAQNETGQQPLVEININTIAMHYEVLGITPREAELLTQVAHGKANKQIALVCSISEGTVRKHLENIFHKLEVNNRVSAVIKSMEIIQNIVKK